MLNGADTLQLLQAWVDFFNVFFISPLFNQVGQLRTSSHLQLTKIKQSSSTHTTTQSHTWNKQNIQSIIQ